MQDPKLGFYQAKKNPFASYLAILGKTGNEIYLCKLQPQAQTVNHTDGFATQCCLCTKAGFNCLNN